MSAFKYKSIKDILPDFKPSEVDKPLFNEKESQEVRKEIDEVQAKQEEIWAFLADKCVGRESTQR